MTDGTAAATSVYDGAGQRVATIANGTTSIMVYDAGGNLVAEYGQAASSTSGTSYVFADQQGSPRVIMNQSAELSRHDYQPFGEEIATNVGLRTTTQGYAQADGVRQKYAGMEKDEATGMSHTLWRKYDSQSGRWTSPDPYGGSMAIADPQSFNRYSYVNNDPLNLTDTSGLSPDGGCGAEFSTCSDEGERSRSEAESAYEGRLKDSRDAMAANNAAQHGHMDQFWDIVNENPNLEAQQDGVRVEEATITTGGITTFGIVDQFGQVVFEVTKMEAAETMFAPQASFTVNLKLSLPDDVAELLPTKYELGTTINGKGEKVSGVETGRHNGSLVVPGGSDNDKNSFTTYGARGRVSFSEVASSSNKRLTTAQFNLIYRGGRPVNSVTLRLEGSYKDRTGNYRQSINVKFKCPVCEPK